MKPRSGIHRAGARLILESQRARSRARTRAGLQVERRGAARRDLTHARGDPARFTDSRPIPRHSLKLSLDSIVETQHASVHLFHHDARGRDDFVREARSKTVASLAAGELGSNVKAAKGPPPQRVCAGSNVDRRGRKDAARERVVKNVPRLIEAQPQSVPAISQPSRAPSDAARRPHRSHRERSRGRDAGVPAPADRPSRISAMTIAAFTFQWARRRSLSAAS